MADAREVTPLTKKVVFHASSAHPAADNRIFHKECQALSKSGLEIHLAAIADADETKDGIQVHALPPETSRVRRVFLGYVRIGRILREVKPDLLHVHDPELIPFALLWVTLTRRPAIYDAHEDLPKDVMGKTYLPMSTRRAIAAFARALEWAAGHWLSMIVAATPMLARNFPSTKVVTIENFPWLASFKENTPITSANPRNFAYVGGLRRENGLLGMFSAIETSTLTPPMTLTIAGRLSPEIDQVLRDKPHPGITCLGNLPVNALEGMIGDSIAGLAVLQPIPNYLESQPTKLYEYMASERPFVASNFPYFKQLFEQFDCGLFVDPCDPEAIRDAMETLTNDLPMAEAMGKRGRVAFEEHFTFDSQATQLCDAVKKLLPR